jgi:IS30 family transposase
MERLPRRGTAESIRAQVWDRWAEGLNLAGIARDLNVRPPRVVSIIHGHGGIRPAQRRRSARVLKASEREAISRGLVAGCSMREIARICNALPRASAARLLALAGLSVIAP